MTSPVDLALRRTKSPRSLSPTWRFPLGRDSSQMHSGLKGTVQLANTELKKQALTSKAKLLSIRTRYRNPVWCLCKLLV